MVHYIDSTLEPPKEEEGIQILSLYSKTANHVIKYCNGGSRFELWNELTCFSQL